LSWQVRELTALAFDADAWQETIEEHARLSHAASLIEAAEAGLDAFIGIGRRGDIDGHEYAPSPQALTDVDHRLEGNH